MPGAAPALVSPQLVEALKVWRRAEAHAAASPPSASSPTAPSTPSPPAGPRREVDLLNVPGIGPTIVQKYGQEILGIVGSAG